MLEKIEYILQKNKENIEFLNLLCKLFQNIPYVIIKEDEIDIMQENLFPKTVFKLDKNINNIQLNIGNEKYANLLNRKYEYKELTNIKRVNINKIAEKLKEHIIRIDHTGINLLAKLYSKEEYKELLKYISSISNMYSYPTGEPWYFILPATIKENKKDIANFDIIREPKFELVYDEYIDKITLQIDIGTDLSKNEVEDMFPGNEGEYFKGLEDVYKAVYLEYEGNIQIRFDIRFKSNFGDFESGKWLVKDGKRVN